ncbi:tRNA uridine-5-carboxymethylaminomethyl(34) synthesis enzyme MnmG [Amphibiibacter pelophylacis]|uniref:tRNA uridine-5-carboxymethylaminomethyl(34) synthesis enzyme MnmG n=1 Tax=Amphibiibacter pelophylacis TaxID=1799477 RepID=A0ACC6P1E6_9BURK
MDFAYRFDVIVVGGGHAGTEAALAASRMGCRTLLLTHNIETLGQMSCNPSIGGIGKGHIVKEVDALGGLMAEATDHAGIQFRILNDSKGPAVRATRAQADRLLYKAYVRRTLENAPGLLLFQQAVDDVLVEGGRVTGVCTQSGIVFHAPTVVLTAGTFLNGVVHVGLQQHSAGRAGDPSALRLSDRLKELKLPQDRLKTGTPPRIDGRSINFDVLERQPGDGMPGNDGSAPRRPLPVFSFLGDAAQHPQQLPCWIAHTSTATHDILREGFDRSPMFTGVIGGVGPRYCPSIEDKINRFADKDSHQIFLEPEGLTTHEFYPNGISTSLPFDIQWRAVRSIRGLENAHILRPGYAIEYDYFDPRHLHATLETRAIQGLFFAGQINGTTGYEEAAGQGLVAGANAAAQVLGRDPLVLQRHEAYIGVLVNDLTTRGVTEPYRMFTSRAEYRLQLREDNADLRLTERGRALGLVNDTRWDFFQRKRDALETQRQRLASTWVQAGALDEASATRLVGAPLTREYALADLLKRPGVTWQTLDDLAAHLGWDDSRHSPRAAQQDQLGAALADQVIEQLEIETRYAGYIRKQAEEIERLAHLQGVALPADFDYASLPSLGIEAAQRLNQARPATLHDAAQVSGITPATLALLMVHFRKRRAAATAA